MTARQEEHKDPDDKSKTEKARFLQQTQTKLIGKYFCYRSYLDEMIRIRNVVDNKDNSFRERIINVKPVLVDKKEDLKFI